MNNEDVIGLGFETGFCQFCRYETDTKPYPHEGDPDIWLCDFCSMLSRNEMKDRKLRPLNWGLNHILKVLKND